MKKNIKKNEEVQSRREFLKKTAKGAPSLWGNGSFVVFGEYAPELPLRNELYYLCKNEYSCIHIWSDFESDAKVSMSKPRQGVGGLKRCA